MKKIVKIKSVFMYKNSNFIFNLNADHFQIDNNSIKLIWNEIKLFSLKKKQNYVTDIYIQHNDPSLFINQKGLLLKDVYNFILNSYNDLIYYYETTFITDVTVEVYNEC